MVDQLLFIIPNSLIIKQLPIIVIRSSSLAKDYVCQMMVELGLLKIRLERKMFHDITGQVSNYFSLRVLKVFNPSVVAFHCDSTALSFTFIVKLSKEGRNVSS